MAKLFIQDTTLTAIADAIREKTGGVAEPATIIIHAPNTYGFSESDYDSTKTVWDSSEGIGVIFNGSNFTAYRNTYEIQVPGAAKFVVKVSAFLNAPSNLSKTLEIRKNWYSENNGSLIKGIHSGVSEATYEITGSDKMSIFLQLTNNNEYSGYGFYVEITPYDTDGNQIMSEGNTSTYTPLEMPAAILAISGEGGGGITPTGTKDILENGDYDVTQYASAHVEVPVGVFPSGDLAISANGKYTVTEKETVTVLVPSSGSTEIPSVELSGNCDSACKGGNQFAKVYIENYPDKITTSYINNADNMFSGAEFTSIPITLNFYGNSLSCNSMFYNCKTLESLPTLVNMAPNALNTAFYMCEKMRYMNELADVDMRYFDTDYYAYGSEVITYCRSLRSIPSNFTKGLGRCRYDNEWNHPYFNDFVGCYNLDELLELGVSPATLTYNFFGNTLQNACALRRFTFEVNEDGSPKTANWTGQVIKLSTCVGWGKKNTYYTQNSGRSSADFMYDSATYAANKNNPNRIAMSETSETDAIKYATYNKASAIETINTLPDTSASGGANTIKFKGAAGSATDEGAINTMTDAQIAVAAAKGWTVTFE